MELTNEIKQNIITAIKDNRENYPSTGYFFQCLQFIEERKD